MKYLSWITSGAVLVVAVAAFVLAFHNVTGLAVENGINRQLAWLVPIIVEGAMLALAFTRLESEVNGRDTRWQVVGIVAFVMLAIALNVAHSNMKVWGVIIAGLQPVSLLVAFEAFMYQLRNRIAEGQQVTSNPWRGRIRRIIGIARTYQRTCMDLQGRNNELQLSINDLHAQNEQLQAENKELQALRTRWNALGNSAQTIVRLNAGEINEQQAISMTGYDPRTVRAWSDKLNGVAK